MDYVNSWVMYWKQKSTFAGMRWTYTCYGLSVIHINCIKCV